MLRTCGLTIPRGERSRRFTLWFGAMDMVDFVRLVSTGTNVLERSSDELLRWVLLRLSDGRQLLLAERTYRDGTKVLVEPTEEELQAARRDPWAAWNAERAEHVAGIDELRRTSAGS